MARRRPIEARIVDLLVEELRRRGMVLLNKGVSSRAGKEDACHDDETNAPESSGRTGSKTRSAGGSRRWSPAQMEKELDDMFDTFKTEKKRRTGS
jgi:hypothetical protein